MIQEDIESLIDKGSINDCWLWKGPGISEGYGRATFQGKRHRVHRLMLIWYKGSAPEGKGNALHSCDNKMCCNPNHLRWGTQADNIKDMDDRDRRGTNGLFGSTHGRSKLTDDIVREIRRLYKEKVMTQRAIAKLYSIGKNTINEIITGKRWGHIL